MVYLIVGQAGRLNGVFRASTATCAVAERLPLDSAEQQIVDRITRESFVPDGPGRLPRQGLPNNQRIAAALFQHGKEEIEVWYTISGGAAVKLLPDTLTPIT